MIGRNALGWAYLTEGFAAPRAAAVADTATSFSEALTRAVTRRLGQASASASSVNALAWAYLAQGYAAGYPHDVLSSVSDVPNVKVARIVGLTTASAPSMNALAWAYLAQGYVKPTGTGDTISAVADAAPVPGRPRAVSDTASAVSDTTKLGIGRFIAGSPNGFGVDPFGLTPFSLTPDAISAVADSPPVRVRTLGRSCSDTAASISDSTARASFRFTTDGLSSVSDAAPQSNTTHTRTVGDVVVSILDLPLVGPNSRAVFDTATAIADTTQAATTRPLGDIAASVSDATPTSQRGKSVVFVDQLAAMSENVYAIYPAFARLRLKDRATTDVQLRTFA